jgi:hypothetical protein
VNIQRWGVNIKRWGVNTQQWGVNATDTRYIRYYKGPISKRPAGLQLKCRSESPNVDKNIGLQLVVSDDSDVDGIDETHSVDETDGWRSDTYDENSSPDKTATNTSRCLPNCPKSSHSKR